MTRLPVACVLLLLAGCSEPERDRASGVGQAFYCRLYPSKCVPVPTPPDRPAIESPAPWSAPPIVLAPEPPPVVEAPVVPPEPSVSRGPEHRPLVKAKPTRPRPKLETAPPPVARRAPRPPVKRLPDSHPVMSFMGYRVTCADVRGQSKAERERLYAKYRLFISEDAKQQAIACLR